MKSFYSCIDVTFSAPSSIQYMAIREAAAKAGGKIVFYGSEDRKTLKSQAFIRTRLRRMEGIDGICFFTFHQFRHGDGIDWALLKQILEQGLEIHFAREGFGLTSLEQLKEKHLFLFSVDYTMRPDRSQRWLPHIEP